MKTIFLTSLLMSTFALSFAQRTPTSTSNTVSTSSSTSSYVRSVSDNEDGENLSISINETDILYKLRAKFSTKNDASLKELLINEFGEENLHRDGKNLIWTLATASDEIYKINFTSGQLLIELDKVHAAKTLTEKFIRNGQEIKELLSGEDDQKTEALQIKADQLQRDAQRMQVEAERLEKRKEQDNSDNEVKALKLKAEKLQQKVDSLLREMKRIKEN